MVWEKDGAVLTGDVVSELVDDGDIVGWGRARDISRLGGGGVCLEGMVVTSCVKVVVEKAEVLEKCKRSEVHCVVIRDDAQQVVLGLEVELTTKRIECL